MQSGLTPADPAGLKYVPVERYLVNEIFYSLQGEGVRAGAPSFFLRLAKCNLTCKAETHGFDCDTEFESGRWMTLPEILDELRQLSERCEWIVLTGGEPALFPLRQLLAIQPSIHCVSPKIKYSLSLIRWTR